MISIDLIFRQSLVKIEKFESAFFASMYVRRLQSQSSLVCLTQLTHFVNLLQSNCIDRMSIRSSREMRTLKYREMSIMRDSLKCFESIYFIIERKHQRRSILYCSIYWISSRFNLSFIWTITRFKSHCSEENFWRSRIKLLEAQFMLQYLTSLWSSHEQIVTYSRYLDLEVLARSFCRARFIIFEVDERRDNRDLNVHLNQQAIDLFVSIVKTDAIQDNVNISLWDARNSTLK